MQHGSPCFTPACVGCHHFSVLAGLQCLKQGACSCRQVSAHDHATAAHAAHAVLCTELTSNPPPLSGRAFAHVCIMQKCSQHSQIGQHWRCSCSLLTAACRGPRSRRGRWSALLSSSAPSSPSRYTPLFFVFIVYCQPQARQQPMPALADCIHVTCCPRL